MKHKILTTAVALLLSAAAMAQTRVEPMNWWVGMKNPDVQVMIYDKDINKLEPSVDAKGIEIKDVTRTDNPNYLFVTLTIGSKAKAGNVVITLEGDGRKMEVNYPLLKRRDNSRNRRGFSSDDAVMLIMPDRFSNGDPTNDTVEGMLEKANRADGYGRHGGDLRGIINHIDYFQSLGMTTLWLTPVMENDMPQSSYHGYAITNYYQIDRRLGTLDDMKELSAQLHKRGMKHIMDMVCNHCGTNYWWMNDLPKKDWINKWYDEQGNEIYVNSNFRLSILNDPHTSKADFDCAQKGWFDKTMADMNMADPLVRTYMTQNAIWWVEMADLDGIRQDTYPYSDVEAMREWCEGILNEYPSLNIVGECWISEAAKLAPWQRGYGKAHGLEDSGLPSIMDFPLQESLCRAMSEGEGWSDGANRLYDSFANDVVYPDPMNILIFGENHDTGRLFSSLKEDETSLRLTTALLATARGIPQLYYGTEALMKGNGYEGHCFIREDFPGGWEGDSLNYFTSMPAKEKAMYDYTARLFKFRHSSMALRQGSMTHYLPHGNVYVYFRYDAVTHDKVMVVLNLAREDRELKLSRFADQLGGAKVSGLEVVSGQNVAFDGTMTVPARQAMVIDIK